MELKDLVRKLKSLSVIDKVNQRALDSIHTIIDKRIFRRGEDANGKALGRYSESYMKTRKRGVVYVKKGKKINNTYPSGTKIILQATSAMNIDFKFLVLPGGKYGSGFSNDINFKKSHWVEDTYKKEIFEIAKEEDKKLGIIIEKELQRAMNKL